MAHTLKRFVIVLIAIGLVTGGLSPVTPVAADHDCSTVNKATWFAFSGPSVIGEATGGSGVGCDMWHEDTAIEEIREAEDNQTELDLYSAATAQKAQNDNSDVVFDNYLQDTESVAWMKAEAAIAQAYDEGKTKSEAKIAAQEAIGSYYATKQINLIESWNTSVQSGHYLRQRAIQEDGIPDDFASDVTHNPQDVHIVVGRMSENEGQNKTLTLVNDTSHTAEGIFTWRSGSSNLDHNVHDPTMGNTSNYGHDSVVTGIHVNAPNSDYDRVHTIKFYEYEEKWNNIENQHQSLLDEVDGFVEATWQDYQDGNIDSTDILSRTTLMFEYGTKTTNGSGNMYDAIGAVAGMGLATPRLNQTGMMEITIPAASNTHHGMVFARNIPDNGTWKTGQSYNPDNFTSPVMIATDEGELFEVEREFTIDSIVDTEGNEVDSVETTSYNYQTSDTSSLNEKYSNLLGLTQELNERIAELEQEGSDSNDGGAGIGEQKWYQQLVTEYFGIPLWGYIVTFTLVAYIANAVRKE